MPKSLGQVIRIMRQSAGLKSKTLARAANLPPGTLTRLENGERKGVNLETACRLALALGVSVDELAAKAGLLEFPDVVRADIRPQGAHVAGAIDAAQRRLKGAVADLNRASAALKRSK